MKDLKINKTCDDGKEGQTDISDSAKFRKNNGFMKSYSRVISRSLSSKQKDLLAHTLPQVSVVENLSKRCAKFNKIALEIGFGSGENIIHQSQNNPDTLYIGAEPYLNGAVKLLNYIDLNYYNSSVDQNVGCDNRLDELCNILVHTSDIRELFDLFKENSIIFDEIFILYPDPWPKLRHHKKRLINDRFLTLLSNFMDLNSRLYITTDHVDYASWIGDALDSIKDILRYEYSREPAYDATATKYQNKGLDCGRMPHYLNVSRVN